MSTGQLLIHGFYFLIHDSGRCFRLRLIAVDLIISNIVAFIFFTSLNNTLFRTLF